MGDDGDDGFIGDCGGGGCDGFIPTSENMMVYKKNSGLLLILIP